MIWQPGLSLEDIEKKALLEAFRFYHGNRTMTANSLKISQKTLYNKLLQYGVQNEFGLERESKTTKINGENSLQTASGLCKESDDELSSQSSMPL